MEFEDITYFLDNNQSKFSVICVRFMYKYLALCYIFFFFFNPTPFIFLKTFLVLALNATGKSQMQRYYTATKLNNITSPPPITRTVTQVFPDKIVPEHLPLLLSGCKYGTKR